MAASGSAEFPGELATARQQAAEDRGTSGRPNRFHLPLDVAGDEKARRGSRWRRNTVFACFQAVYWSGIGAMFYQYIASLRQGDEHTGEIVFGRILIGLVGTTIVHFVYVTWLRGMDRAIRWPILAAATLLVLGVSRNLASGLFPGVALSRAVVAALWFAVYVGIEIAQDEFESLVRTSQAEARASAAEAAARASELERLESQLNPHFLFNALNAVAANSGDPEAVVRVTQDLADFLRSSLRKSRPLEPLSMEIEALEKYLSVQQARFGDDLVCEVECDRESPSVLAPPRLIQPLLENAFEYGGRTSPRPLVVKVKCRVEAGWLVVTVSNTGSWVTPGHGRSSGIGLGNLRERLALLLGRAASVGVEARDGRVIVTIRTPAPGRPVSPVAEA